MWPVGSSVGRCSQTWHLIFPVSGCGRVRGVACRVKCSYMFMELAPVSGCGDVVGVVM